jgi:uncharacterized protein YuzE
MVDPYKAKLATSGFFKSKRIVNGVIVVVMDARIENRNIQLIHPMSRCFRKGDVCELVTVNSPDASPGNIIKDASYLGFAEILCSGSLVVGDTVKIKGEKIGKICGFDETHAPNHINVVIQTKNPLTGIEMGLEVEDGISFELNN